MPKRPFEEDIPDAPVSEEPLPRSSRGGRGMRGARGKAAGGGFFASMLARAKAAPAPYWVLGLGAGALAVDYFIEGPNSIASSIYRGIFGPSHAPSLPPGPLPAPAPVPHPAARAPQMPVRTFAAPMPIPYYLPPPVYYQAGPAVYPTPRTHRGWHLRRGWERPWFGPRTGYEWE